MEMMRQQQQLLPVGAGSILELAAGTSVVAAVGPAAAAACIKLLGAAAEPAEIRLPFEPAELQQYSEETWDLPDTTALFVQISDPYNSASGQQKQRQRPVKCRVKHTAAACLEDLPPLGVSGSRHMMGVLPGASSGGS